MKPLTADLISSDGPFMEEVALRWLCTDLRVLLLDEASLLLLSLSTGDALWSLPNELFLAPKLPLINESLEELITTNMKITDVSGEKQTKHKCIKDSPHTIHETSHRHTNKMIATQTKLITAKK